MHIAQALFEAFHRPTMHLIPIRLPLEHSIHGKLNSLKIRVIDFELHSSNITKKRGAYENDEKDVPQALIKHPFCFDMPRNVTTGIVKIERRTGVLVVQKFPASAQLQASSSTNFQTRSFSISQSFVNWFLGIRKMRCSFQCKLIFETMSSQIHCSMYVCVFRI